MRVVLLFVIVFAALPAFAQLVERETPPCSEQAIAATRAGAERKDPASLYLLGRYYGTGKCLAGDGDKAIELYWQAAELGYPPAFYNLGMIAAAQGDFKTAEKLFLTGAGVGHRGCELQLGILYHFDIPNMHDDAKAYAWLSLSALRTPEALEHLERVRSRLDTPNRAVAEGMFSYLRSTFEHVPEFKSQQ